MQCIGRQCTAVEGSAVEGSEVEGSVVQFSAPMQCAVIYSQEHPWRKHSVTVVYSAVMYGTVK